MPVLPHLHHLWVQFNKCTETAIGRDDSQNGPFVTTQRPASTRKPPLQGYLPPFASANRPLSSKQST